MSIIINPSGITIQNRAGQEKFNSSNKLLYQKTYQTGSVSCSGASVYVSFPRLVAQDFLVLSIRINSASGQADFINTIINKEIPANGGVIVDFFGREDNRKAAADSEILGVDTISDYLIFKTVRYTSKSWITPGTTTVNLTYFARIWSFL
jgi:hypothetical protein